MPKRLLIFDVSNMAHRSFHTMGDLSFESIKTGVVFGFLKSVESLTDRFDPSHVVFAFDAGIQRRLALLSSYKLKRHSAHANASADEQTARQNLHRQIALLKEQYLPQIGYKNIFFQRGYEADDIIASVVKNKAHEDTAIIVSSDSDLWQLIIPGVYVYNTSKQKLIGHSQFIKEIGIDPNQWARVKAMTGCSTDEIPGVKGVGEKTAVKYIRGELTKGKAFNAIVSNEGKNLIKFNKPLVRLPFDGTQVFTIQDDKFSLDDWNSVCEKLGMRSMLRKQMKLRYDQ